MCILSLMTKWNLHVLRQYILQYQFLETNREKAISFRACLWASKHLCGCGLKGSAGGDGPYSDPARQFLLGYNVRIIHQCPFPLFSQRDALE